MLRFGPFTLYRHDLGDYMRRWILVHPWGTVRLHHILQSDADLELHDHPWNFVSLILWGGYMEITPKPGCEPADGRLIGTCMRRRHVRGHPRRGALSARAPRRRERGWIWPLKVVDELGGLDHLAEVIRLLELWDEEDEGSDVG